MVGRAAGARRVREGRPALCLQVQSRRFASAERCLGATQRGHQGHQSDRESQLGGDRQFKDLRLGAKLEKMARAQAQH